MSRPTEDQLEDMFKANDKLLSTVVALSGFAEKLLKRNDSLEQEIGRLLEANEMLKAQTTEYGMAKSSHSGHGFVPVGEHE